MIVTIGSTSKQIEVSSYKPNYELGVQWLCIGGVWQGFDRGIETDHFSTTVTVSGYYADIQSFRDFILEGLKTGSDLAVTCNDAELIFGCEFDYSTSIICSVFSSESVFSSQAPGGHILGEWSFSLFPVSSLSGRFISSPASLPTLYPKQADRMRGIKANTSKNEIRNGRVTFGTDEPTVTLVYRADRATIAQAKRYLQTRRLSSFSLTSPDGVFYFSSGVQTQNVYFGGLVDSGNIDQWSDHSEISVTYLLAR